MSLATTQPLSDNWLKALCAYADRADENLGTAEIGPMLHRVTRTSALGIVQKLREATPGDVLGKITSFVDLGCGRGLTLAAALSTGYVWYAYGYDINRREVDWANQRWIEPMERWHEHLRGKAHASEMNALDFDAERHVLHHANVGDAASNDRGIDPRVEVVWIYALWSEWPLETIRHIAKRLLVEQGHHWTVLACSAPSRLRRSFDLLQLAAETVDKETGIVTVDEQLLEQLEEAYEQVNRHPVHLSGSGEAHSVYFYRHTGDEGVLFTGTTPRPEGWQGFWPH